MNPNTNRFNENQGYVFDKGGNIVQDVNPLNNLTRNFTFDGNNKQTKITDSTGVVGEYFYDGEGKRVKKKTQTELTIFVYSNGKLIAEYSTATPTPNPTTNYTATDTLGSPRVLTDANGQVKSRRDFMPFGEEIGVNTPQTSNRSSNLQYNSGDNVRQKFTGYQKDAESNLDFAEARYYNSNHGRFTAVDPLLSSGKSANPQTFNRFVYTMNQPTTKTDPSGLQVAERIDNQWKATVKVLIDFYDKASERVSRTFSYGGDTVTQREREPNLYVYEAMSNSDPLQNANMQRLQNALDQNQERPARLIGNQGPTIDSVLQTTTDSYKTAQTIGEINLTFQTMYIGFNPISQGLIRSPSSVTTNIGGSVPRLSEGMNIINNIRSSLNIGSQRNIAIANYKIDGSSGQSIAVSGQANRPGTVDVPGTRLFTTKSVGGFSRANDSEVKLFEFIGQNATPSSTGSVNIFTQRPMCTSCSDVRNQFNVMFPRINVTVGSGPQ